MTAIALTAGDPAGIGCEIACKAWKRLRNDRPFFLIGDLRQASRVARETGIAVSAIAAPEEAPARFPEALPVLDHPLPIEPLPGTPDPANAGAVVETIRAAVSFVRSGRASALCTNPINKKALHTGAQFPFPGHTEFLAHLCDAPRAVMMLVCAELRVVPVTVHVPLVEVAPRLTEKEVVETIALTDSALRRQFGIPEPRIAVSGLNPHAGEQGSMGSEETAVIAPAILALRARGINAFGPLPADTMFHAAARRTYDVAVCMYHDQALIPIKTLDFEQGVNVTLGLDFVRTSPDHGTAYDIAGTGRADPRSLVAALGMAGDLAGPSGRR
jgi:4-hydroxythreonine-4-phosphate dehydrogenase